MAKQYAKKIVQLVKRVFREAADKWKIRRYLRTRQRPWSTGYSEYKERFLRSALDDAGLLARFKDQAPLPARFGYRLDERAVEYPWLFSRLTTATAPLLDAGSALNFSYLLQNQWLRNRPMVVYTLSPEQVFSSSNVSYIYGDLRQTVLKDALFEDIVSISTIEHVGMNNRMLYSRNAQFNECDPDSYLDVIREYRRLLKAGGRLFVTVPFGKRENLVWLQQFDAEMVSTLIDAFGGPRAAATYYKYQEDGWQVVDADACADCRYFDMHRGKAFEPDYLAAARAVACIELEK